MRTSRPSTTRELLSIRGHAELTHYEERLKMVLGEETFPWPWSC